MNVLSEASLIHCLRGLSNPLVPQESSKHFSKYLNRSLIFECQKDGQLLI